VAVVASEECPRKLLDDGQGSSALDLAQGPAVAEAVRVNTFREAGLGREPLAESAHVAVNTAARSGEVKNRAQLLSRALGFELVGGDAPLVARPHQRLNLGPRTSRGGLRNV